MVEPQSSKLETPDRYRSPALEQPALSIGSLPLGSSETTPDSRTPSVAVGADDFALLDLSEHGIPLPISEAIGDAERLIAYVIELQYDYVGLATIHTGVGLKERLQKAHPLFKLDQLPLLGVLDVAVPIVPVVLLLVLGPAESAVTIPQSFLDASPGELVHRLQRIASSAAPPFHREECMNAL